MWLLLQSDSNQPDQTKIICYFFSFKFQLNNVQLNNIYTNRIYYVVVTSYFIKFPINIPYIFSVSVIVLWLLPYEIAMCGAYILC